MPQSCRVGIPAHQFDESGDFSPTWFDGSGDFSPTWFDGSGDFSPT